MSSLNLAQKYRPKTFEEFKGSPLAVYMLTRMTDSRSLPPCMIFSGPRGTGKTSAARIINKKINGEAETGTSYIEVDAASNSGVDNIRALQETVRYAHSDEWRLCVLDEAHNLSSAAFNALLKILEDPPPNTTFVLITTKPDMIPDTVQSRAMSFRFNPVPMDEIIRRLVEVVVEEDETQRWKSSVITRIAEVSDGSLRNALVLLQQLQFVERPTVDAVNQLSGNTVDTQSLMYAMLSGDLREVEQELSQVFFKTNDMSKFLHSLVGTLKEFKDSHLINAKQFLACMEIVWSMRKMERGNDLNARTQMEAGLFAMFSKGFWNGEEGSVPPDESLTPDKLDSMIQKSPSEA